MELLFLCLKIFFVRILDVTMGTFDYLQSYSKVQLKLRDLLKDAGATKMAVIKLLKEITGLGLVEAKALADNGGNVKENVPAKEAEEIKAQLEEAGATVELA